MSMQKVLFPEEGIYCNGPYQEILISLIRSSNPLSITILRSNMP